MNNEQQTAPVPLDLLARLASNSWYLWAELAEQKVWKERIYRDWQDAMAICERAKRRTKEDSHAD